MTPETFQTLALSWLAAISIAATAGVAAFFKIKSSIDENKTRIDKHDTMQGIDTKTPPTPSKS